MDQHRARRNMPRGKNLEVKEMRIVRVSKRAFLLTGNTMGAE